MENRATFCHVVIFVSAVTVACATSAPCVSEYDATMRAPAEIRLDQTRTVPITLEVAGRQGAPFTGRVELWADYGRFVAPDGSLRFPPFSVQLQGGRAQALLSLEGRSDVPYPLRLFATTGPYGQDELIAQTEVRVRYPEHITVEAVVPSVPADGLSGPVVLATIRDQFGQVLDAADVTVRLSSPEAKGVQAISGRTDARGEARLGLPPSKKAGYARAQVITERLASAQVFVLYGGDVATMLSLHAWAAEVGAGLYWDADSATATVSHRNLRVAVRVGEGVAWLNSRPVPLAAPVRLRDGRVEVPVMFLQEVLGWEDTESGLAVRPG